MKISVTKEEYLFHLKLLQDRIADLKECEASEKQMWKPRQYYSRWKDILQREQEKQRRLLKKKNREILFKKGNV